jgi:uncharacterized protein YoxC
MGKLQSFQTQIQEAVEKGIATIEEQHKVIAEKSFGYAEKVESEAKSYSIKTVQKLHDDAVGGVYESIRTFNARVNEYVSDLVSKVEKVEEAVEDAAEEVVEAVAKKAPAKKKPAAKKPAAKKEAATA